MHSAFSNGWSNDLIKAARTNGKKTAELTFCERDSLITTNAKQMFLENKILFSSFVDEGMRMVEYIFSSISNYLNQTSISHIC